MANGLKIAIVGAGIGGLAAAALMLRRGLDVTLYEQAPALGEIGAGVQLGPNAMKVMRALGVERDVIAASVEPDSHILLSWKTGRTLFDTPLKRIFKQRYGAGYYQIHRADLHRILQGCVPASRIRLNAKCTGARNDGARAILTFADGSSVDSDIVIGADGIHSVVRSGLFGAESPRFTGNICWRGTVPSDLLPQGTIARNANIWLGPHGHIVTYYVRGGKLVNFVAMYEADNWRDESWSTLADKQELLDTYVGWHPTLLTLFAKAERVNKWALYDRDPLPRWGEGRITMLGDAAHPMLPYLAQGAAMAIEDGYVLARRLAETDASSDISAVLKAYEGERLPRTTRVQLGARARAGVNHISSPLARLKRDLVFAYRRMFDRSGNSYKIDWVYAHDVTAPPGSPS